LRVSSHLYPRFADLKDLVHEFNSVIREFCRGFEDPKVRNAKDIVKFNEDNAKLAMPERSYSWPLFVPAPFKIDHELAHPNQKDLITSSNSTITDEECETAAKELRRLQEVYG